MKPAIPPARWLAVAALLLCAHAPARAQDSLRVGDPAPVFEGRDDRGRLWRSRDHVGKRTVVVYFYPAAMTGGCTKQACGFRDNRARLDRLDAVVVGVSGDRVENLVYFKQANRLDFPLLADTSGAVARAFGVPLREGGSITRSVDGKEVSLTHDVTAARWTFVIGKDRRVAFIETQVDAASDADSVVAVLQRMRGR